VTPEYNTFQFPDHTGTKGTAIAMHSAATRNVVSSRVKESRRARERGMVVWHESAGGFEALAIVFNGACVSSGIE
jgi:hypothetical protein